MAKNNDKELKVLEEKNKQFENIKDISAFWVIFMLLFSFVVPFLFLKSIKIALFFSFFGFVFYMYANYESKKKKKLLTEMNRLVKQLENKEYGLVNLLEKSSEDFNHVNQNLPLEDRKMLVEIYDSLKNNKFYEDGNIEKYIDLLKYIHYLLSIDKTDTYSGIYSRVEEIEEIITNNINMVEKKLKKYGFLEVFKKR